MIGLITAIFLVNEILILFGSRGLYMEYQKKRVGEVDDDRLKFEISTMYSREVLLASVFMTMLYYLCRVNLDLLVMYCILDLYVLGVPLIEKKKGTNNLEVKC